MVGKHSSVYTMKSITRNEGGQYKCIAENPIGSDESEKVYIMVQCKYVDMEINQNV